MRLSDQDKAPEPPPNHREHREAHYFKKGKLNSHSTSLHSFDERFVFGFWQ
jgi:hypothetical protein